MSNGYVKLEPKLYEHCWTSRTNMQLGWLWHFNLSLIVLYKEYLIKFPDPAILLSSSLFKQFNKYASSSSSTPVKLKKNDYSHLCFRISKMKKNLREPLCPHQYRLLLVWKKKRICVRRPFQIYQFCSRKAVWRPSFLLRLPSKYTKSCETFQDRCSN